MFTIWDIFHPAITAVTWGNIARIANALQCHKDCHEFGFSIVRVVISVWNGTSLSKGRLDQPIWMNFRREKTPTGRVVIWSYLIISGHIWPYLVICDHTWSYVIINFGQQISDFLLDKLTSKALKTRKPGTFCKNTLWINTLWNEHLSLHTHFREFKPSYTFPRII